MPFQLVKLLDPITVIPNGLVPRGAYNAVTDYAVGDSVDYSGSSYVMFLDAAAGTTPTNTTYWQVLANKGANGSTGATGSAGAAGAAGAAGVVQAVVAGSNITVDNTDPANPVIASTGGGVTDGDKGDITVTASGATWTIDTGLDATKIGAGGVTSTEFGYIGTLTSDAQTQINTKSTKAFAIAMAAAL